MPEPITCRNHPDEVAREWYYTAAYRKDGKPRKRNTYVATCWECGCHLEPGDGTIERRSDGTWTAHCAVRT